MDLICEKSECNCIVVKGVEFWLIEHMHNSDWDG